MSGTIKTTEERWRRYQRDLKVYRWRPDLMTRLEVTYPAGLPR